MEPCKSFTSYDAQRPLLLDPNQPLRTNATKSMGHTLPDCMVLYLERGPDIQTRVWQLQSRLVPRCTMGPSFIGLFLWESEQIEAVDS